MKKTVKTLFVILLIIGLSACSNGYPPQQEEAIAENIVSDANDSDNLPKENSTEFNPVIIQENAPGESEVNDTEAIYFYAASNNTETRVIRNLFLIPVMAYSTLDMPFHAWNTPINLNPGEQSSD